MIQDLRYAVRTLANAKGFTIAAVACLAVSIGLNATIFSLFDALVLHPYTFDTDRLVSITPVFQKADSQEFLSGPEYDAIRTQSKSISSVATYDIGNRNLTGTDTPERLVVALLIGDVFKTYGISPVRGRAFTAEESAPGFEHPVVIISHRLWQTRLGLDPRLPGGTIEINGIAHTVVGVLPARFLLGFKGLGGADLYMPFRGDPARMHRSFREMKVVGRLRDGATVADAGSEWKCSRAGSNGISAVRRPSIRAGGCASSRWRNRRGIKPARR